MGVKDEQTNVETLLLVDDEQIVDERIKMVKDYSIRLLAELEGYYI